MRLVQVLEIIGRTSNGSYIVNVRPDNQKKGNFGGAGFIKYVDSPNNSDYSKYYNDYQEITDDDNFFERSNKLYSNQFAYKPVSHLSGWEKFKTNLDNQNARVMNLLFNPLGYNDFEKAQKVDSKKWYC